MDKEYIERDAALEVVNGWREQLIPNYGENDEYVKCLETVAEHLYDIPAADVRPVVSCKDCKYYYAYPDEYRTCHEHYDVDGCSKMMPCDGFCSKGERR